MANIVELRDMSGDKLKEMLENGREELFNLRFQTASAQLEDYSRVKEVRREIAQLETVLHMRQLAKETAVSQADIAETLKGKTWKATARFNYEDSGWRVEFSDEDNNELASALVNLNKKRPRGRRARSEREQPNLVANYKVAG